MNVYGVDTRDHLTRMHKDAFAAITQSIFINPSNWIFDFFEYISGDSKRLEELKRLRISLIPFLIKRVVTLVENCHSVELQNAQM